MFTNRAIVKINGIRREFFATGEGMIWESVANGSCPPIGQWKGGTLADTVKRLLTVPECAQCKLADRDDSEAIGLYTGKVPAPYHDRYIPYRAWLCADHLDILVCDGAELSCKSLSVD